MPNLKLFLRSDKIWLALALLTPPLLALIFYGRVLSFPFFLDDDLNFTWMRGRALLSYWVDSSGYKYYRPITFGMWRLAQIIFGETNTFAFQAINFVTLILVGWLVSYLAAYLNRDGENSTVSPPRLREPSPSHFPFCRKASPMWHRDSIFTSPPCSRLASSPSSVIGKQLSCIGRSSQ
jgi:hypothetical protein